MFQPSAHCELRSCIHARVYDFRQREDPTTASDPVSDAIQGATQLPVAASSIHRTRKHRGHRCQQTLPSLHTTYLHPTRLGLTNKHARRADRRSGRRQANAAAVPRAGGSKAVLFPPATNIQSGRQKQSDVNALPVPRLSGYGYTVVKWYRAYGAMPGGAMRAEREATRFRIVVEGVEPESCVRPTHRSLPPAPAGRRLREQAAGRGAVRSFRGSRALFPRKLRGRLKGLSAVSRFELRSLSVSFSRLLLSCSGNRLELRVGLFRISGTSPVA
jgi:hypothetical protein